MIAGGSHVYEEAMSRADEQVLTEVHRTPDGDTFYPDYDPADWAETTRETHDGYDWVWLQRRRIVSRRGQPPCLTGASRRSSWSSTSAGTTNSSSSPASTGCSTSGM